MLLLKNGQVVGPADGGGSERPVDEDRVFRIVLVEFFNVAELPGAQHFGNGVVDGLLIGHGDQSCGTVGWSDGSVFLFLLRGCRRDTDKERGGGKKQRESASHSS